MQWSDIGEWVGKAAPLVGGLLGGPVGATVGGLVASALGVKDDPDEVAKALKSDPQALIKIKRMENEQELKLREMSYQAEQKQLSEINQTMRVEAQVDDKYVRRWRPTFGYAMTATWSLIVFTIFFCVIYTTIVHPQQLVDVVKALGSLVVDITLLFGIPMTVLGVSVKKRSDDKKVQSGIPPVPLVNKIAGIFQK